MNASKAILRGPGGVLGNIGTFVSETRYNGDVYRFRVHVVKNDVACLLGRCPSVRMNLVTSTGVDVDTVRVPPESVGTVKGSPVKIALKQNAQSYCVSVARRVPIPILDKVKEELKRMERVGVIREITSLLSGVPLWYRS